MEGPGDPEEFLLGQETFRIRGAIFAVHNAMGHGFLEAVYQECLAIELEAREVPFKAKPPLQIQYAGKMLQQTYAPDFLCFGSVIVELKAVREFAPGHRAQLCNYLKATGLRVGLLVNFGAVGRAAVERMVI